MAGPRVFPTNISVEIPMHRKLCLVFRNNMIKVLERQRRCGYPGEPGCWQVVHHHSGTG